MSERRARSRNLKPVRSADFPMRTRPLTAAKPTHPSLSRLDASMATSRDHVLQQTRSDLLLNLMAYFQDLSR